LFLPHDQIGLVLNGKRTLLLLPRGDEAGDRPPHHAGSTISLQPAPTESATCRVRVTRVTDVALGELDDDQARELGFRDRYGLQAAWIDEHGGWSSSDRAWLLKISVDPRAPARLLRRRAGYTTDPTMAIPGAGEAVDDFALAAHRRAAHARETERFEQLLEMRRRLPHDKRLTLVMADAAARDVSIDRELHVIGQRLDAMEARVYRPADRTRDGERCA
jgi:hypothetical protein